MLKRTAFGGAASATIIAGVRSVPADGIYEFERAMS